MRLSSVIREAKDRLRACSECFNQTDGELCEVCKNPKRDRSLICVVEQPRDLLAIEKTGRYSGVYHVLEGHIAPLEGVGPEHLTIEKLLERVKKGSLQEVILALNPTMEGDATALYLSKLLAPLVLKVTRLARGIPSGGNIEYASSAIIADALAGRTTLEAK